MRISIVGLGKLGLPFAAAIASRGFNVIGYDIDAEEVYQANTNAANPEPWVNALLAEHHEQFLATTQVEALADCAIILVIVPTPSDSASGMFSVEDVIDAMSVVGAVQSTASYRLFVLMSTVMPGQCEREVIPALEAAIDRPCGEGWGFCYNPEFVALGQVVENFTKPDLVLIGQNDDVAGALLEGFYQRLLGPSACVVRRMSIVSAELAKLTLNVALTQRISYANMLAEICEALPDADVDDVTGAIGMDHRIGPHYLKAGAPYGGPCFPRDTRAMTALMRTLSVNPSFVEAIEAMNDRVLARVIAIALQFESVGILGITYKLGVPYTDDAPGILLAMSLVLRPHGICRVVAYDPEGILVSSDTDQIEVMATAQEVVDAVDCVVMMQPHPCYEHLIFHEHQTVIDVWRTLIEEQVAVMPDGVELIQLGIGA